MIEILLEGRKHGAARLRQAIERALELGCSDKAAVQYLLTEEKLEKKMLSPVRNARSSAGFVVKPLAGTRYSLYSSF
jgi:hypothetical protein